MGVSKRTPRPFANETRQAAKMRFFLTMMILGKARSQSAVFKAQLADQSDAARSVKGEREAELC